MCFSTKIFTYAHLLIRLSLFEHLTRVGKKKKEKKKKVHLQREERRGKTSFHYLIFPLHLSAFSIDTFGMLRAFSLVFAFSLCRSRSRFSFLSAFLLSLSIIFLSARSSRNLNREIHILLFYLSSSFFYFDSI